MSADSSDVVELPAEVVIRLVELAEANKRLDKRLLWRSWSFGVLVGAAGGLALGLALCRVGGFG